MKSIADARVFAAGMAAIDHIKEHGLKGVELYCVFRNISYNTSIPVDAYVKVTPRNPQSPIKSQSASASRNEAQTTSPSQPAKPTLRVLLVEDDPDDADMLKTALRTELSCEVIVAFTKEIFEAELQRKRPDLIISDSNVRTFDGITALKTARKKYPDIPFIFCSGSVSPEKREAALALGATAWTSKQDCFKEAMQIVMRLRDQRS